MILLISIKTLKDKYLIDDNLEDKYLISNISKAQDFVVAPLIGEKFTEIKEQIENDSLTDDNKYLLDKIEPVIAYYVMSEVVYSTAYKFKNKGLEDANNASKFSELVAISKKYLMDSQHYAQILGDYFSASCTSATSKVYKSGLYLG